MSELKFKNPLGSTEVVDLYFLEHRAKLIDIGAFLDRLQRACDNSGTEDFRIKAFNKAAGIITDQKPDKARRMLEVFSDFTSELPVSALQSKGASGAAKEAVK